ncbi:hypothetical protein ABEB36_012464 [Hypothenemus hampei]
MSGKSSIERIKENAQTMRDTINSLKNELTVINKEYNNMLAEQLRQENAKLLAATEEAKRKLVQLEIQNGIKQIPVPHQEENSMILKCTPVTEQEPLKQQPPANATAPQPKPKKEKKPPKEIPAELSVDVGRLDLKVGKVEDVQRHPDADSLYVLKINCGEDKPRTVCSGLVKHVPIEELQNRLVMLLCNLKPVKMRGITSEAMVMCASSPDRVEVLIPPPNCEPGDLVHCDGYTRQPDGVMNPKKKIFETVAPDLHTNDNLEACYKGVPFTVPGKGNFVAKTLKNVAVK